MTLLTNKRQKYRVSPVGLPCSEISRKFCNTHAINALLIKYAFNINNYKCTNLIFAISISLSPTVFAINAADISRLNPRIMPFRDSLTRKRKVKFRPDPSLLYINPRTAGADSICKTRKFHLAINSGDRFR